MIRQRNRGKGAAIRAAIPHVDGEIAVIQDADMEYDPADVPALIEPIERGVADVVYGSRLSGGRPQRAYLFWHLVGNRFLSLVTSVLFNTTLSDMETGYKAFRADVLRSLDLRQDGFAIEPEITGKICRRQLRIYELPISYYGRTLRRGEEDHVARRLQGAVGAAVGSRPRLIPAVAASAALAVALASAVSTFGTTWDRLSAVRRGGEAMTSLEREHAGGDALPLPMDRFDFYRRWLRSGDRYWLDVAPSGYSSNLDLRAAVAALARFYLLPAVQVARIDDANVVLSWDKDPGLLHLRYTVKAREGKQVVFVSRIAGR